ncbi:DUF397 domain-containing protein [Actinoallomurus rhizosphaericola]
MNVARSGGIWRKSSYSGEEVSSNCVEVAQVSHATTE